MRKAVVLFLLIALITSLAGCADLMYDMDDLIDRAREEFPIADRENTEIQYAGMCSKGDLALMWFISGNEYQAHSYLPMEVTIEGEAVYRFSHVYKPMDRGTDIAVLQWQGGYAFLINNPQCKAVQITDSAGIHTETIEENAYPYVFYRDLRPTEYVFLDQNNNQIS